MTAPVITTLLTPNPASGSQTADGAEDSLASGTAAGAYQLSLDTHNMADGDVLEVRAYDKPGAGATKRQVMYYSLANAQSDPSHASPIVVTDAYIEFSIKQTAGVNRVYAWAVRNVYGS